MIKSENARPSSWVYVDITGIDLGTFVQRAQRVIAEKVDLPNSYSLMWSGRYESMQQAQQRLIVAGPLALLLIILLLYLATRSWFQVILVTVTVLFFARLDQSCCFG